MNIEDLILRADSLFLLIYSRTALQSDHSASYFPHLMSPKFVFSSWWNLRLVKQVMHLDATGGYQSVCTAGPRLKNTEPRNYWSPEEVIKSNTAKSILLRKRNLHEVFWWKQTCIRGAVKYAYSPGGTVCLKSFHQLIHTAVHSLHLLQPLRS